MSIPVSQTSPRLLDKIRESSIKVLILRPTMHIYAKDIWKKLNGLGAINPATCAMFQKGNFLSSKSCAVKEFHRRVKIFFSGKFRKIVYDALQQYGFICRI